MIMSRTIVFLSHYIYCTHTWNSAPCLTWIL